MTVHPKAVFNLCENVLMKMNFKELVAIRVHTLQHDKIRQQLATVCKLCGVLRQLWEVHLQKRE